MKDKILHVIIVTTLILLFSSHLSHAALRTASVSGNWSNTATWGGALVPTSADDVRINGNITVSIDIVNAQCASLIYLSINSRNTTVTISGSNSLVIGGLLSMPYPNEGSICRQNVNAGTFTAGALKMGATVSGRNNEINITTGTLTVLGAIITGSTGCQIRFTGAGIFNMEGNLNGSPTLTTIVGSSVNYKGSANQTIYATTYNGNLGISGNVPIGLFSSNFGNLENTLANSELAFYTWNGSESTIWITQNNWTPVGLPSSISNVIIPDASTTLYSPTLPASTEIKTLSIETAGILNAVANEQLTVNGDNGAWSIAGGTYNPGTSNVIFTGAAATISGITNFFDVTINPGADLRVTAGSTMRIVGTITNSGTWHTEIGDTTTVEYNGGDQNVVIPNPATSRYHNLILSGSGTKTMPGTALAVYGDFSLSGTATVTAAADMTVEGGFSIANGSNFSINPGVNMSVNGTLTNNAGASGLILKSDATGTGSLIHNTNNVPATVQRYITGAAEDWHFLSSPVSNQPISGSWLPSGTYGNGTGYDLYLWDEPNNCWIYNLDITSAFNWNMFHPGANFEVGRGYLYSVQALNPTKEFSGYLNNGLLNDTLSFSSTDVGLEGFNLFGNPYPSSIDWGAASGWSRSNLVESGGGYDMWIWNPAASNYGVSNSYTGISTNDVTQYIAPMQGFFVQALSAGHIAMNNNVRSLSGADDWHKSSNQNSSNINVSVISEEGYGSDETIIDFGYSDNENGATKLFSRVPTAPSLYMVSGGDNLSVRYLSNTEDNPAVPLFFKPGVNGKFTLNCCFDQSSFETVILEDRKEKSFHDMKGNNTYSFWSSNFDAANRFVLYFGPVENNPEKIFPANIYTDGHDLIIDLALISDETETLVNDTMGRLLLNRKLEGKTLHRLNLNANPQIIVISLKNPDGRLTQKLYWK